MGNDNDTDTFGCLTLRVEHITLHKKLNKEKFVVEFDFFGKDSVMYKNKLPVGQAVYKYLQSFINEKGPLEQVFDHVTVSCVFMTFLKHELLIILLQFHIALCYIDESVCF